MNPNTGFEQDLASIRQLMERSVKFVSLSGLSGILAGTYALVGAAWAYRILYYPDPILARQHLMVTDLDIVWQLIGVGALVLLLSLGTGVWLSIRKAGKMGISVWGSSARRLFVNLGVPLITGGLFCLICLWQGQVDLVASSTLIFYGLALVNASPNLYDEVRYLGLTEIGLGLLSMVIPGYTLVFWAIGFGLLHILYGVILYRKYE